MSTKLSQSSKRVIDHALVNAWRLFVQLDTQSTAAKRTYKRISNWIPTLSLFFAFFAFASGFDEPEWVVQFSRIIVMLSIIVAAMISYRTQFEDSSWVTARVYAEAIRSEIYLYRLRAGKYLGKTDYQRQKLMLKTLTTIQDGLKEKNMFFGLLPDPFSEQDPQLVVRQALWYADDGFSDLTIQYYVEHRIKPQITWYFQKTQRDYTRMRRYRVYTMGVFGMVSVSAALGLGFVPLLLMAIAFIAMTIPSTVSEGATYALYVLTANRLQDVLHLWDLQQSSSDEKESQSVNEAIVIAEDILKQEREQWAESLTQTNANTTFDSTTVSDQPPMDTIGD